MDALTLIKKVAPGYDWVSSSRGLTNQASELVATNCPNVRVLHLSVEEDSKGGSTVRYDKFRFVYSDQNQLVVEFLDGPFSNVEVMDVKYTKTRKFKTTSGKRYIPFGDSAEIVAGILILENM